MCLCATFQLCVQAVVGGLPAVTSLPGGAASLVCKDPDNVVQSESLLCHMSM